MGYLLNGPYLGFDEDEDQKEPHLVNEAVAKKLPKSERLALDRLAGEWGRRLRTPAARKSSRTLLSR